MKSLFKSMALCVLLLLGSESALADDEGCLSFCDLNNDGQINCLDFYILTCEWALDGSIDPYDPNHSWYLIFKKQEQRRLLSHISIGLEFYRNELETYPYPQQYENDPDPSISAAIALWDLSS